MAGRLRIKTSTHVGRTLADAARHIVARPSRSTRRRMGEDADERYLVIDRSYPPGHRHGRAVVAAGGPAGECGWPALAVLEPSIGQARVLFIDLETTGLAGGAGTYAFLVGCGWFQGATFKVRQFLLARYAAERPPRGSPRCRAGGARHLQRQDVRRPADRDAFSVSSDRPLHLPGCARGHAALGAAASGVRISPARGQPAVARAS